MFKPEVPHFFKVILDDTIREGKLAIPKKFVRRYANYLSNQVFLKVPSGAKWQVELVKSCDNIWFGKGWQKFVDYYSLSHGSFLVFKFENLKGCCFNVTIFDTSASEIDYPIQADRDNEEANIEENIEIDVSQPSKKKKRENDTGLPAAKRCKRGRIVKRIRRMTPKEKAYALKRANIFYKSINPSFSIVIQPSHVGDKCRVDIPSSFTKTYIKNERGNIILNLGDEKTWSVEYSDRKRNGIKEATVLWRGWKKFVDDNHLEVGDVCIFELIDNNATEFKVVICRKKQDATRNQPIGNKQNLKHKEIRDLNKFTTQNPYFEVNLMRSYLEHGHLRVPLDFVAKCKKRSIEKLLLQVGNKVWPVKLKSYRLNREFRLSAGFPAFVKDNSLQVGDFCVFELINGDTLLVNVTIFRKQNCGR